jgi:hypothetical protein
MRRHLYLFMVVLAFTGIACPPTPPTPPGDANKKNDAKATDAPPPPVEDLTYLQKRIEAALEHVENRDLRTDYAFWTVFHGILGSGPEKAMLKNPETGKRVNAVDYICDGGQVRGMQFLPTPDGLDVRSAMGMEEQGVYQGHQDQFVAEMTQWGMPKERRFRVGGKDFTFEDFIRQSRARASVTKKQELSWAILIIAQHYGTDYAWTNNAGEKVRFDEVVRYELDQPIDTAACGGTHRLFGLTWAYHLHLKNGGKKDGVWKDVETKIESYKLLAHKLQNPDRSFSTDYFKGPERKQDSDRRIGTTGHTVEWLALAMTDDELKAPWMQDAVNALVAMILNMGDESIDSGSLYHAAHGLRLYHDRMFGTPAAYVPLLPKK